MVTPPTIAAALHGAIDDALKVFANVAEPRTAIRPTPDTWSAREVLGHLIDSACNNHRRFVLAQTCELARFDGYDQNAWVSAQRYHEVPWRELVGLWTAYNRLLAHVIAVTPPPTLARSATSPDGTEQLTLGFVMEDYVQHLRHHVNQLKPLLTA